MKRNNFLGQEYLYFDRFLVIAIQHQDHESKLYPNYSAGKRPIGFDFSRLHSSVRPLFHLDVHVKAELLVSEQY